MVVLGIDPGTARMGYGLVKLTKTKISFLEADVLTTAKELEASERLKHLYNGVTEVLRDNSPDLMVIERLFFSSNVKTAIGVGQARGVAMLAAAQKNIPVFEYTALEAKLVLTGYGRSDKKVVQEAVKNILKLDAIVKSDDANDAVAMALCYIKKEHLNKEFAES